MGVVHSNGWAIGMTVCAVFTLNRRTPDVRIMEITKVGRRWITIGEGYTATRFDADTMWIDGKGYSSPGKIYPSESEYLAQTETRKAWDALRLGMPYTPPAGITLEQIASVRALVHPTE